ncbi:MAG: SDR family NAD(P)-dependent oxidoreductase [Rickettsiaceae bacterium]
MTRTKKTIIITGASSGLGAAIAINYSRFPCKLFLIGRSSERLQQITDICSSNGAEILPIVLDVTDSEAMERNLKKIAEQDGIDIVIACAGVSAGTLDGPETAKQVKKIFDVNVDGVLNTVLPVIPHMVERRSGQIAIVSSMAGFVGLASAPSYSASKGAVRLFSDALRGYLKPLGINVTTVIPGYIKTPMTKVNNFPMPFMISAEKAAQKIINGIGNGKEIIAFPWIMYLLMKVLSLLPSRVLTYINSKLPGKPAFEET